MAVKQGGPDPDTNVVLRRAIQNAKAVQMPKDRIESAIKKASDKDTTGFDVVIYNTTRTVANVRSYFRKKNGSLGTSGMHNFIFDRKGVFYIEPEFITDAEEFELEFIDFGLEKIVKETVEEKEFYQVYVNFEDFGKMQEALESQEIKVEKSELERIPNHTKEISNEEQLDEVLALIDLMEQDDDVTNVFHNLA